MKKKILSLTVGAMCALSITAFATTTTQGSTSTNAWSGKIEGSRNSSNCYASTTTTRRNNQGSTTLRSYVEIVNKDGYVIGSGSARTEKHSAYSGTVTINGGRNAYESHGLYNHEPSRTNTRLY